MQRAVLTHDEPMMMRTLCTLVVLVLTVQPLAAVICAGKCGRYNQRHTRQSTREHCDQAAASALDRSSGRPNASYQGTECKHPHPVCAQSSSPTVDNASRQVFITLPELAQHSNTTALTVRLATTAKGLSPPGPVAFPVPLRI
jgi:hypothetical protein